MTSELGVAAELPLEAGHWTADLNHSSVSFTVRHLGLSKVRGRFERFSASMHVGASLDDTRVSAAIELSSVNTNSPDRDAHLRTSDFFSVEESPLMTFESSAMARVGDGWSMAGLLTLNGVAREMVLPVAFNGTQPLRDVTHAGFEVSGELRRSQFGIDFGLLPGAAQAVIIADTVRFELDLQFVPADVEA